MADDQYLEYADFLRVPNREEFLIETHVPKAFTTAYHHHASVEINFLFDCDLEYSFSGSRVLVPRHRMTVFWGAMPHGVLDVKGRGRIINIYASLALVLKWGLPRRFTEKLMGGDVLSVAQPARNDPDLFDGWAREYGNEDAAWRVLLAGEIEMRLRRMALEEQETLLQGAGTGEINIRAVTAMRYVDRMLRFIADNYSGQISVSDVAEHVGLSPSYTMALFRRAVGVPIKTHITRIRLSHAQMLLANSNLKILSVAMDSGFNSLSSFYEAFHTHTSKTPAAFRLEVRG